MDFYSNKQIIMRFYKIYENFMTFIKISLYNTLILFNFIVFC